MALTKETKIAKIEMVGDFKIVHIAYDEIVKEDGVEISKRRLRDVVDIGRLDDSDNLVLNDYTQYHQDIQDVIAVAYTDTIKENWKQHLIKRKQTKENL
tara:strand:+ start:702 stop:998 length:297 start_codon:yes stop_codon:yes gene_type:complete